jgi:hypothetical protein
MSELAVRDGASPAVPPLSVTITLREDEARFFEAAGPGHDPAPEDPEALEDRESGRARRAILLAWAARIEDARSRPGNAITAGLAQWTDQQARVMLSPAERFFFDRAGASYVPGHETLESGTARGAILLAGAVRTGIERGWRVTWEIDPDADIKPAKNYFVSGAPHWQALLTDGSGDVLAALGSIDLGFDIPDDPGSGPRRPLDDDYARVVAAELALEALWEERPQ